MGILKTELIERRKYQEAIAETAIKKNTLVVLPTGMGKTLVAVFVGAKRLEKFPDNKILITAPTRPLNAQHKKSFEKFTNINKEKIVLITGKINPADREKIYKQATIVVATPQCIENDLKNGRLNLENFSFITIDEAHRCVKDYAYTFVAKKYMEQAKNPLILGLTASPGSTYEQIDRICKNLFIEAVEIRTEMDEDVEPYVKPISRECIYVEFPEEFRKIKNLIEEKLKENTYWLKEHHYIKKYKPSKKQLLELQEKIFSESKRVRDYSLMWVNIRVAEAIKLEHALELLETQGIYSLKEYLEKLKKSKKRTDKRIVSDERIVEAMEIVDKLYENKVDHPKLEKLEHVIKDLVKENLDAKIIVFSNYRSTIDKIIKILEKNKIKSKMFIGQATRERKGLKQEEQLKILKNFKSGLFNVLVATSIGEEGIDVPAVDYAIFYEPIPSEIRTIQRRGRVGRQEAGKAIFLITKGTRDEAYYWASFYKEKRMKGILYDMKNRKQKKKRTLKDWIK